VPEDKEVECIAKDLCNSEDPNMVCLAGVNGNHRCSCKKGFKESTVNGKKICTSDQCNFDGLHRCPQGCKTTNTAFECVCVEPYKLKTSTNANNETIYECTMENPPKGCESCTGKYQTCNAAAGKCGCIDGYELDSAGSI